MVVSAGYDQSVRAWDCRSHSTEPIQVKFLPPIFVLMNFINIRFSLNVLFRN